MKNVLLKLNNFHSHPFQKLKLCHSSGVARKVKGCEQIPRYTDLASCLVFEAGSYYVVLACLERVEILFPPPPVCWDYSCTPMPSQKARFW